MKRRDLIRELERAGCVFDRHGHRHDIYQNLANGQKSAIPRHREISKTLAEVIRKQLGLTDDANS